MILLSSKSLIAKKKLLLQNHFALSKFQDSYLAILYFGHDPVISVYVRNKVRFGNDVGLRVTLFGQEQYYSPDDVYACIQKLNEDIKCVGIIIQLPLPSYLQDHRQSLCDSIQINKDVDALTSTMIGRIDVGSENAVYPAAVWATVELLKSYNLYNLKGRQVSIIGQSTLVGKPLALACINQWAQVHSFGIDWDPAITKEFCNKSDYIISATGVIELITKEYVRNDNTQVIVDIGYGIKEGKAIGDVAIEDVQDRVYAVTPVPGGIGPLCVCQLFENVVLLNNVDGLP